MPNDETDDLKARADKAATKLEARADQVADELEERAGILAAETHALNKTTQRKIELYAKTFRALLMMILIALIALGVVVFFSLAASRSNGKSLAILQDFQNPNGCAAKQGQYGTAVAIWKLEAFDAKLHHVSAPAVPKPPPKCNINALPTPAPTRTVTRVLTRTVVVPGPTHTVVVTKCVRPNGRPC